MHDKLTLSAATLLTFLLILARVGGALVFVPTPGLKASPEPVRVAFALGLAIALWAQRPATEIGSIAPVQMIGGVLAEAAIGISVGVCVAIALEAFVMAAQILGLQAGYAYASTIDPTTQADSGILLVFAQLLAGMLFFVLGLDRDTLRLFAESLQRIPPGAWALHQSSADHLIGLGSSIFSVGFRLALPVVALLILVDVSLALLGRLNAQLQLMTLAFPAKMLAALLVLGWIAAIFPRLMREAGGHALRTAHQVLGL